MNFKQSLSFDAERVFLNPSEFGEAHTINGVQLVAVVSGPESAQTDAGDGRNGLVMETAVLNIQSGLMPLPHADRALIWNGEQWLVASAKDEDGIFHIELYRERS
ncbi:nitrate reductase [Desulfovibrio sp. OttesenSCG-928-G11]|nr:nitrate reductase [Desulfovibrio sp. OttesenSCG-928-G11]